MRRRGGKRGERDDMSSGEGRRVQRPKKPVGRLDGHSCTSLVHVSALTLPHQQVHMLYRSMYSEHTFSDASRPSPTGLVLLSHFAFYRAWWLLSSSIDRQSRRLLLNSLSWSDPLIGSIGNKHTVRFRDCLEQAMLPLLSTYENGERDVFVHK
jgi:hypothetical protein